MANKGKLSIKDKLYAQALIKHKGNQTKAYKEVYPDSEYNSSRANAVRKTKEVIAKDSSFTLEKITPAYIIEKIDELAGKARKDSDKLTALNLLGKFRALFTDKIEQKTEVTNKQNLLNRFNIESYEN